MNAANADTITAVMQTDSVYPADEAVPDITDEEYATFFIVVADTSPDYYSLHKKMFRLSEALNLSVDTLGRHFNKSKNLIALPDDDSDEMYAGSYFPRRFPSENLSLEYLGFYRQNAGEKTIALVSGIYDDEKNADSALTLLKRIEPNGFKIKANVYTGCMH